MGLSSELEPYELRWAVRRLVGDGPLTCIAERRVLAGEHLPFQALVGEPDLASHGAGESVG